jgi:UTP--glucose-1-phosphate uridylyltransferase
MAEDDDTGLNYSLQHLPPSVKKALEEHNFDRDWLLAQAALSKSGKRSNLVSGTIHPLLDQDLVDLPVEGSTEWEECRKVGEEALRKGQCALAVLAGGMATRMGGVIKALVEATMGQTFLDLRLNEQAHLASKYSRTPPLWLMTSHATHEGITEALGTRLKDPALGVFRQGLSVRLDEKGDVFRDDAGAPSLHAPGHGDFVDCLKNSGLLAQFVESGGRYLMVTNLDNLGGGLDPVAIGLHIRRGRPVTCEVVDKEGSDRGGIPARLNGRPVILEEFRIPPTFDPQGVTVFNVNTFAFDASALQNLHMDWTYFEVKKTVDERIAVQYERLINEVTFQLDTQYLRVPRNGADSRFLPVKDHDELAQRQPELKALALARGMIEP